MAAHGACGEGNAAGGGEVVAAGRKMRDSLMRNADECPTMEEFLGRLEEDYAGISSKEGGEGIGVK